MPRPVKVGLIQASAEYDLSWSIDKIVKTLFKRHLLFRSPC